MRTHAGVWVLLFVLSSHAITIANNVRSTSDQYQTITLVEKARDAIYRFRDLISSELTHNHIVPVTFTFHDDGDHVLYPDILTTCTSSFLEQVPVSPFEMETPSVDDTNSVKITIQMPERYVNDVASRLSELSQHCTVNSFTMSRVATNNNNNNAAANGNTDMTVSDGSRNVAPQVMMAVGDAVVPDTRPFSLVMVFALAIATAPVVYLSAREHIPEAFQEYQILGMASIVLAGLVLVSDLFLAPAHTSAFPWRPDVVAGVTAWAWVSWMLLVAILALAWNGSAVFARDFRLPPPKKSTYSRVTVDQRKAITCDTLATCVACTSFGCGYDTSTGRCEDITNEHMVTDELVLLDASGCAASTTVTSQLATLSFLGTFIPRTIDSSRFWNIPFHLSCQREVTEVQKFFQIPEKPAIDSVIDPIKEAERPAAEEIPCPSGTWIDILQLVQAELCTEMSRASEKCLDPSVVLRSMDSMSQLQYYHGTTHTQLQSKYPTAFLTRMPINRGLSMVLDAPSRTSHAGVYLTSDDLDQFINSISSLSPMPVISPNAIARAIAATSHDLLGFVYLAEHSETIKRIFSVPSTVLLVAYAESLGIHTTPGDLVLVRASIQEDDNGWQLLPLTSDHVVPTALQNVLQKGQAAFDVPISDDDLNKLMLKYKL